jgi:ATP sulfurylase
MLSYVLGSKREEVPVDWRIFCKEELPDPYCSPNTIIWAIKSRRMRYVGHVEHGRSG